mmetsp:Transcript_46474/g.149081  ORF Transcript_46474/g.149081 Transcript_46474/m.149081 type:complete len:245 (-) Transcript_46474:211-945(-)
MASIKGRSSRQKACARSATPTPWPPLPRASRSSSTWHLLYRRMRRGNSLRCRRSLECRTRTTRARCVSLGLRGPTCSSPPSPRRGCCRENAPPPGVSSRISSMAPTRRMLSKLYPRPQAGVASKSLCLCAPMLPRRRRLARRRARRCHTYRVAPSTARRWRRRVATRHPSRCSCRARGTGRRWRQPTSRFYAPRARARARWERWPRAEGDSLRMLRRWGRCSACGAAAARRGGARRATLCMQRG